MSRRTVFTTITPLPANVTREVVTEFLHNHLEMIDLNPLVKERHPIKPPSHASPEEFHCIWYSLTDKINYMPGGLVSGDVSYTCAFHDLPNGLQTHCYAPMGLDIRDKWTLCGSLPGEPVEAVELGIGAPITGLYIREDIDMKCNIMLTAFVKKNLKRSHAMLVDRMKVKAQIASAANLNHAMSIRASVNTAVQGPGQQSAHGSGIWSGSQNTQTPPPPPPPAQSGSPDPSQFPVRPASTATNASGGSHKMGPSPHSPDPTRTDFGQPPYSPPGYGSPPAQYSTPASQQGHQSQPPPLQGSVTWQSLKPSASMNSAYNPVHARTPSNGSHHPHHHQQQQGGYAPPPQQQQYQQQYGQQLNPYAQQNGYPHPGQQQQPYAGQQNGFVAELGGPYPQQAPPVPVKDGAVQGPGPGQQQQQQQQQQPPAQAAPTSFVAELE